MQLRVLSLQSQANVVQAQREYESQWRQLAATIGLPDLPPTELHGSPDMPVPAIDYQQALATMLENHTDLAIASNAIGRARILLRLAQVTPVPDVNTYVAVQHDYTFDPGTTTYNLQLGGQLPVFNRNRGNIISAQAQRYRAEQTVAQVRNDLIRSLADAFARYDASRVLVNSYREQALRDQVRAYRGIYERYRNEPAGVQFNDVVVAQQVLADTLRQYVNVLGDQWQAVVDLAELTQVDDIYTLGAAVQVAPLPDLDEAPTEEPLPPLP
jgi:outer membrane protein TolC